MEMKFKMFSFGDLEREIYFWKVFIDSEKDDE